MTLLLAGLLVVIFATLVAAQNRNERTRVPSWTFGALIAAFFLVFGLLIWSASGR